jgi:hypothetical protein
MKTGASILTAAALLFAVPALAQETAPATPAAPAAPATPAVVVDEAVGLPAWDKVYKVFSHPRCANCHVEDDHPRWSGPHYGPAPRNHAFNVQRGVDGSGFGNTGLRCTTCHFESNSTVLHGPPGAHNWHLAPVEMVWFGQTSAQICAQIKDPARNGDRTLDEVAEHIKTDKLVAWGWAPGPGREPAPGSAEETYAAIQQWAAAGAPCPAN